MATVKGRVRKFGNDVNTDAITPGSVLHLSEEEMIQYAFGPIAKDFYKTVQPGDIIVAGNNFGCGSSREPATMVVKLMGFEYIVCESMARIYFRNCVATGVYPIMAKGSSALFGEGDPIEIDLEAGEVRNPKTGSRAHFNPLSGTPKEILDGGGILKRLKQIREG